MSLELSLIKNVDKLVPRPEIALEVLNMAHDIDCDIPTLSNKIKQDPGLTANMLRLANSAYFGHMKSINSITDIIVRLGIDTVKLLAITSASVGVLKSPQEAYNLEPGALWDHSYATAVMSSVIGRHAQADNLAAIYSAALLHDIGKVILNKPLQNEAMNRGDLPQSENIIEFEQEMLHTDHARVGMVLLEKWGLPESITLPVGMHHTRKGKHAAQLDCQIVFLANYLTESIGIQAIEPENYFYNVRDEVADTNDLPDIPGFENNLEGIIEEFFEKYTETKSLVFS